MYNDTKLCDPEKKESLERIIDLLHKAKDSEKNVPDTSIVDIDQEAVNLNITGKSSM